MVIYWDTVEMLKGIDLDKYIERLEYVDLFESLTWRIAWGFNMSWLTLPKGI